MTTNAVSNLANGPGHGRPVGSRNRLSHKLIADLSELWHQLGPEALRKMALRDPAAFARMAYSTLPKDILVSVEQKTIPGGLDPESWAMLVRVLDTIKGAIPAGANAPPAEIFGVIDTALRAHYARQIGPGAELVG